MSDSLCEIGQYEKARDYIHTGSYYRPKIGETQQSRKEYIEEYNERKRKVDVLITYELTDSVRFLYRIEKGNEFLLLNNIPVAAYYFEDAQKYVNGRPEARNELLKIINALPTDTIQLGSHSSGNLQLLSKGYFNEKVQFSPYLRVDQFSESTLDTLFLRKDTSLFTGVITSFGTPRYEGAPTTYNIWEFVSGVPISQTVHYLCQGAANSNTQDSIPEEHQSVLKSLSHRGFYCGKSEDWGRKQVWFSMNGDTLQKKEIFDDGSYFTLTFHPNGDSSEFFINQNLDEFVILDRMFTYDTTGNIIEYSENKYSSDNAPNYWSSSFTLNQYGDTIRLENWIEGQAQGRFIHSIYLDNDSSYTLKLLWEENVLVNFLSDDILFFDFKGKLIDEKAFFLLINCDFSASPENLIVQLNNGIVLNGKNYSYIAYPNVDVRNYPTKKGDEIWKKIFKSIEKVKK